MRETARDGTGQEGMPNMKLICLLKRKPGMTPQEFRNHYEGVHAPLAAKLLPFFTEYRRNYVLGDGAAVADHAQIGGPDWDVITEFVFESRADYDAMCAALADPVIGAEIAEDEERFLDRSAITVFMTECCETALDRKAGAA